MVLLIWGEANRLPVLDKRGRWGNCWKNDPLGGGEAASWASQDIAAAAGVGAPEGAERAWAISADTLSGS